MTESFDVIRRKFKETGFMQEPGVYALVDGQFGSTGKGLAAALIASRVGNKIDWVTTNAGPNSGHTSYWLDPETGEREKIVLKQLPTSAVIARKMGHRVPVNINAGAIVNMDILTSEFQKYMDSEDVYVEHAAAIVKPENLIADELTTANIGSTGQGIGPALADKVLRKPKGVLAKYSHLFPPGLMYGYPDTQDVFSQTGFMEVSQGFSLGINHGFYPYTTARECTVGAALSDASIHPHYLRQTMMVVRTYPIRVAGPSGPCYDDQEETTWEDIGQAPEFTTVTKKKRRVFTWSDHQFQHALQVNRPDHIFVNFMNYLPEDEWHDWVHTKIHKSYWNVMGKAPLSITLGTSPYTEDCLLWTLEV